MKYDAVIIDSRVPYRNIAFDFGLVNLRLNNTVMTLENLITFFCPEKRLIFSEKTLNLESCGKLNGIFLLDYLRNIGFKCALVSKVLENRDQLESLLEEGTRSVIISTTWTFGIHEVKEISELVREYNSKVPIVVGGSLIFNSHLIYQHRNNEDFDSDSPKDHFFFISDNISLVEDIDLFIIDRAGQKTVANVLEAIRNGKDFYNIANTAFYADGKLVFNPLEPEEINLNDQIISWHKIEPEYIPEIVPMQLSLGCNYRCKFCNFFHKQYYFEKNKKSIRKELKWIHTRPEVRMIRFVDDSMPPKVLYDLCEFMVEQENPIPWTTFLRLDAITPENAKLLKKANCVDIQIGFESGDNRILSNMDKKVTVERYLSILDYVSELDISVRGSFIIGYPGENDESVSKTIDFLNALPVSRRAIFYVGFAPFILLPLAPVYYEHERKQFGLEGYLLNWRHRSMSFADIPKFLRQIFLSVKNEVIFAYSGDLINLGFPNRDFFGVQLARQRYQKGIISGLRESDLNPLWLAMKDSVEKLIETIN